MLILNVLRLIVTCLLSLALPCIFHVARHSWATEALRKNTPMAVIIQGLGHTSEKTTRIYLDSLDRSVMAKANGKIIKEVNDLIVGRA